MALEFSSYLPVSVCGTGSVLYSQSFSRLSLRSTSLLSFQSLTTGATIARLERFESVPLVKLYRGNRISTVCASATPFGLTLAPGLLGADEPSS